MALIVQKYGGTSVGDPVRIRNVAKRVIATLEAGNQVVVCVSAMSGETNDLVELAQQLGGEQPDAREFDVLLSTGEQKTIAQLQIRCKKAYAIIACFWRLLMPSMNLFSVSFLTCW